MSTLRRACRVVGAAIGTAFALLVGCDYDSSDYFSGGGFAGGASSSGLFDAGGRADPPFCDTVSAGDPCRTSKTAVESCERGTFANLACNGMLVCRDGVDWAFTEPPRKDCRTDCPATYTETFDGCGGQGAGSLMCEYDEGTCGCAPIYPEAPDAGTGDAGKGPGDAGEGPDDAGEDAGDGGAEAGAIARPEPIGYEWRCVLPSRGGQGAGPKCPRVRPREGQECVRSMLCDYGACVFEDGYRMRCYDGTWVRDLGRSTQCER